jgi:hypothetical protein
LRLGVLQVWFGFIFISPLMLVTKENKGPQST